MYDKLTTEHLLLWELILYILVAVFFRYCSTALLLLYVQCISVVRLLLLSINDHYVAKKSLHNILPFVGSLYSTMLPVDSEEMTDESQHANKRSNDALTWGSPSL